MSFTSRLRMNGIFGNAIKPPDLNMGSDISGILSTLMPLLQQQKMDDFNEQNNVFPKAPMLQDIGRSAINPPTNRVNTGFMIDGMTPYEHASLEQRKREFAGKDALGRDTLSFKKEDAAQDNQLNKEKLDVTKSKNELDAENRAKRTAIYDFKAKNPGMKFIPVKGGNYMFADPITGDMHDTGIPSGTMTREDEIELQGEQRINAIKQTGKNQLANIGANIAGRKDIAGVNNEARLKEIAARGAEARNTKNTIGSFKTELPTQTRTRQNNVARELINTRPELAPFIKFDGDGNVSIIAPNPSAWTDSGKGPSKETFDEINKIIYGKTPTYKTENKIPASNDKPKVDDSNEVIVEKDGRQFKLPKNELEEAKKQGYKLVEGKK